MFPNAVPSRFVERSLPRRRSCDVVGLFFLLTAAQDARHSLGAVGARLLLCYPDVVSTPLQPRYRPKLLYQAKLCRAT